jgi:hypothetical protein
MHGILRNNTKQGTASNREKKKVKVGFPKYNKGEEEDRHQRGVQLRTQLKKEKESYKQDKKEMAQNSSPRRVYAALVDTVNIVGLKTLATHNRSFRTTLFALFGDVAGLPNANIEPQQADALGVLNALIAANVPFPNIAGFSDIIDCLDMIGALSGFRPFLNPPAISDGSDHDDDGKKDDDDRKNNDKKSSDGGANKRQKN